MWLFSPPLFLLREEINQFAEYNNILESLPKGVKHEKFGITD